jgi:predicted nucleic acid-binding protein
MQTLIGQFKDQKPDLADASLLAVAERLTISQIATFDLQDFNVYRIHCKQKLQLESFEAPSVKNPQRKTRR